MLGSGKRGIHNSARGQVCQLSASCGLEVMRFHSIPFTSRRLEKVGDDRSSKSRLPTPFPPAIRDSNLTPPRHAPCGETNDYRVEDLASTDIAASRTSGSESA